MGLFLGQFQDPLKKWFWSLFFILGVPKWIQKGDFISVLGGHGAPWAPKSVFGPESYISRPPKVTPRSDNRLKKGAKVVEKLSPNLARRTARSGLNKYSPNKACTDGVLTVLPSSLDLLNFEVECREKLYRTRPESPRACKSGNPGVRISGNLDPPKQQKERTQHLIMEIRSAQKRQQCLY